MFLFNPFTDRITRLLLAGGFAVLLPVAGSMPCLAGQTLAGPYTAIVERVIDGDTLAVRVPVWIGQELTVLVRVRGIDAPERRTAVRPSGSWQSAPAPFWRRWSLAARCI